VGRGAGQDARVFARAESMVRKGAGASETSHVRKAGVKGNSGDKAAWGARLAGSRSAVRLSGRTARRFARRILLWRRGIVCSRAQAGLAKSQERGV